MCSKGLISYYPVDADIAHYCIHGLGENQRDSVLITKFTMGVWHWKSHWKVQPHWIVNASEGYKGLQGIITLKFVC